MARRPEIPKQDAERARMVLEQELKTPPYRKPSAIGSYVMLVIALAIAGAIVFYVFLNKDQFGQLWQRATHPDSIPAQTLPDR